MNIEAPSTRFIQLPFTKRPVPVSKNDKNVQRSPFARMPNRVRNHFVAMVGEFIGTFLFLFFAFSGTQVANQAAAGAAATSETGDGGLSQAPNASALLYIALAFGFSLAVNAWVFFRISGGLFNPAVTLGMALIGAVGWVRAGLVFIAQILGSMCSAAVVDALFPGPLNVSTTLGGGTSIVRGLFIEMFLTFELVFTIFMLAAEKHKGTFLAPVGIGLSLFIAELSGVYYTGGSLNPARSFGPCVALTTFPGYHWIYWVGPGLGSLLAVGFYRFVKMLEYETANPGQDFNDKEAEVFEFDEENADTAAHVSRPNVQVGNPDYIDEGFGPVPSPSHSQTPGRGARPHSSSFRSSREHRRSGEHQQLSPSRDRYVPSAPPPDVYGPGHPTRQYRSDGYDV
ncbi:aquaporin-like protein [Polychaeton citri CBS 116435]|uniref:Aquaporin-like protein n=1 Tax=Polychaeton citri CBS 116435 TaxID=1314669 RepID=A0A9P4QH55_9PEZI|nr:aquaporin-like protein [Polychaeton citri CBS 116435]